MGIRGRIYSNERHREELLRVKATVRWFPQVICQEWNDSDVYIYKEKGKRDVIRLGHLDTLRYIEVPRYDIPVRVKITDDWIAEFVVAANRNHKKYKKYPFLE